MRSGNIALIILGIGIIVCVLFVLLVKPPDYKSSRFGEFGKRTDEQETKAASPSAEPYYSPTATVSASPYNK